MSDDSSVIEALKALVTKRKEEENLQAGSGSALDEMEEKKRNLMRAVVEESIWSEALSESGDGEEDSDGKGKTKKFWNVMDVTTWKGGKRSFYEVLDEMRRGPEGEVSHWRSLGYAPLTMAAMLGEEELFWWMVSHDEDITTRTLGGNGVLHVAAERGHTKLLRSILRRFGFPDEKRRANTPLFDVGQGYDALSGKSEEGESGKEKKGKQQACGEEKDGKTAKETFNSSSSTTSSTTSPSLSHLYSLYAPYVSYSSGDLFTFYASKTSSSSSSTTCSPTSLQMNGNPPSFATLSAYPNLVDSMTESPAPKSEEKYLHSRRRNLAGQTCMHLAATHGHLDTVKFLFHDNPQSIRDRDLDEMTPLGHAAAKGHLEIVKWIIEDSATDAYYVQQLKKMEKEKSENTEPLLTPPVMESSDAASQLLFARARFNFTPYLSAALHGHLNVVKYLANRAIADYNQHKAQEEADEKNPTLNPVSFSSPSSSRVPIEILFDTTNLGNSALHVACMSGSVPLVRFLLEMSQSPSFLLHPLLHPVSAAAIAAASTSNSSSGRAKSPPPSPPATTPTLVSVATANTKNGNGQTILHLAAWAGHSHLCWVLGRLYPDLLQSRNVKGNTPFLMACLKGHLDVAKALIKAAKDNQGEVGAVVGAGAEAGAGAGAGAGAASNAEASQTSSPSSASPPQPSLFSATNNNLNTALHLASYGGHPEVIEWLLDAQTESGLSLSTPSSNGNTAFLHACAQSHLLTVHYFITHPTHSKVIRDMKHHKNKMDLDALSIVSQHSNLFNLLSSFFSSSSSSSTSTT